MVTLDDVCLKTIELLNTQKTDYIIIGGLAVGMLGEARMTHDVDVLIAISKKDITSFLKNAQSMGFKFNKKAINNDIEIKGAFRLLYDSFHIDLIVGRMPFEKEAFKRCVKLKLYGLNTRFPSPEDLILFKLIPGREKGESGTRGVHCDFLYKHLNSGRKRFSRLQQNEPVRPFS